MEKRVTGKKRIADRFCLVGWYSLNCTAVTTEDILRLHKQGYNLNSERDGSSNTMIRWACRRGMVDHVRVLLEECGVDVNSTSVYHELFSNCNAVESAIDYIAERIDVREIAEVPIPKSCYALARLLDSHMAKVSPSYTFNCGNNRSYQRLRDEDADICKFFAHAGFFPYSTMLSPLRSPICMDILIRSGVNHTNETIIWRIAPGALNIRSLLLLWFCGVQAHRLPDIASKYGSVPPLRALCIAKAYRARLNTRNLPRMFFWWPNDELVHYQSEWFAF